MLGGLTILLWGIRLFAFDLCESPRFLIGVGKDEEAVAVVHKIAAYNSVTTSLTPDQLTKAGSVLTNKRLDKKARGILSETSNFTTDHVKALFSTRKMAYSTSLLIILWGRCLYSSILTTLNLWQASSALRQLYTTAFCHFCESLSFLIFLLLI